MKNEIMRLFVAINFDQGVKNALIDDMAALKKVADGNFSRKENLHITLAFIGETDRLDAVKSALSEVWAPEPFSFSITGLGRFKRNGGDIWWRGIEAPPALAELAAAITKELQKQGFKLEDREFKPHLTMARKVVAEKGVDFKTLGESLKPIKAKATRVSLMRSDRINGRLTYTEVCGFDLGVN